MTIDQLNLIINSIRKEIREKTNKLNKPIEMLNPDLVFQIISFITLLILLVIFIRIIKFKKFQTFKSISGLWIFIASLLILFSTIDNILIFIMSFYPFPIEFSNFLMLYDIFDEILLLIAGFLFINGLFKQIILNDNLNQQYRDIVDHSEVAILITDITGKITYANPKALRLFRIQNSDLLLMKFWELSNQQELKTIFNRIKNEKRSNLSFKFSILRADGQISWLKAKIVLISKFTKPVALQCYIWDITQEKQYQQLQDQFIAMTSHELRTPLTIIQGYAEFLNRAPHLSNEKLGEISQNLLRNTQRLEYLISSVHEMTRFQEKTFRLKSNLVTFKSIFTSIRKQFDLLYPNRLITMNVYNESEATNKVYIDEDCLLQIIHNLVSNAVKHSPPNSIVETFFQKKSKEFQIIVQDYGVGIPQSVFFKMFTPFIHVRSIYSSKGTGLGLYIVKNLVDAFDGTIEVMTGNNKGTIFRVLIPIKYESQSHPYL